MVELVEFVDPGVPAKHGWLMYYELGKQYEVIRRSNETGIPVCCY